MAEVSAPISSAPPPAPAWWREARFGLFIHWGVYAVPAGVHRGQPVNGTSEWLMHTARVPVADYRAYAAQFTAEHYDPEAWVRAAADAGMGYIVITAKHHDGFALFDTQYSDWSAVRASAAGSDLLAPLVAAAERAGLRVGFYYSQAHDWVNGGAMLTEPWDPAQSRDFDAYLDRIAIPQLRELLTRYGPQTPAVLWWDIPTGMTPERAARVDGAVQALRPGLFQNDRLSLASGSGSFITPEQHLPTRRPTRPWETCMTMNESWGFHRLDHAWKSPAEIIRQLCAVVAQGGNYLLNVGPRADGTWPDEAHTLLRAVGAWMRVNGAAIRGAEAGPFPHPLSWGNATRAGQTLFLLVAQWPADGALFVPLLDLPAQAHLLADSATNLTALAVEGGFSLQVPAAAPDSAVSVIALRYEVAPRLGAVPVPPPPPVIPQPADGALTLRAADAEILGDHLALVLEDGEHQLGCWTSTDSSPRWRVRLERGGAFRVSLDYAAPGHATTGELEIVCADQSVRFTVTGNGSWREFRRVDLGVITLHPAPELLVTALPRAIPLGALMNLRAIHFTPLG